MTPRRLVEGLPLPPHDRLALVHLVPARAAEHERQHRRAAVRVRRRRGVGGQGHEEGDEGFPGDVGRVVVREDGDGFAGAAGDKMRCY